MIHHFQKPSVVSVDDNPIERNEKRAKICSSDPKIVYNNDYVKIDCCYRRKGFIYFLPTFMHSSNIKRRLMNSFETRIEFEQLLCEENFLKYI